MLKKKIEYLLRCFLSLGLYAESHGIIGSSAYDAKIDQTVDFSGGAGSLNAQWWTQAEPIWMTAREQVCLVYISYVLYVKVTIKTFFMINLRDSKRQPHFGLVVRF